MIAMVLALGSALCWGIADFLGGVMARVRPVAVVAVAAQLVGAVFAALCVLFVDVGAPAGRVVAFGAIAGVANVIGLMAFYHGLAIGRMSVVAPIGGLGVLVPVTIGLAGGEQPHAIQGAGMLVAIVGVTLATRQRDAAGPRSSWPTIAFATLAALGIGTNLVLIERAVRHAPVMAVFWAVMLSRAAALAVLVAFACLTGSVRKRPARRDLPMLVLLGGTDFMANIFYGFSSRTSLLSLAAVIASLHPAVTVILANRVLSEAMHFGQRLGVCLAVAGAALLSIG